MSKMSDQMDDAMRYWIKRTKVEPKPMAPPPAEPKKTSSLSDDEYDEEMRRSAHGSGQFSANEIRRGYRKV